MSLLDIYKNNNTNKDWFDLHSTAGAGSMGRMFEYTNSNYRTQNTFTSSFQKFLQIEGKSRGEWPKQADHGQEKHKQYVSNMTQSKLFKKDVNEIYTRTAKGLLYTDFINLIEGNSLKVEDKWFLNYIFLINGYFLNRKNYIVNRVRVDLLGYLLSVEGITESTLINEAKVSLKYNSFKEELRTPFFYFHSLYDDSEFLTAYLRASDMEREELAMYIENNVASENFQCCISKKYMSGSGSFVLSSFLDETKVFLLTLLFIQSRSTQINDVYKILIEGFNENILTLSRSAVYDYLFANRNIFDPIISDILELEDSESLNLQSSKLTIDIDNTVDAPEEYIDETSEVGLARIKNIFALRKRQARVQSGFRCALETINNCNPIYFTAKSNEKNYLELHHLLPQEFRNDFPFSIEVLANYVTLCPRCHKQIHLAIDRERKHLINALYNERKNRLSTVGLKIELEELYQYYKIDA